MKTKTESKFIGDELSVEMEIDFDAEGEFDTRCRIDGEWWVGGDRRHEFIEKLGKLIDEYRI